jgi:hypothetical protein
MAVSPSESQVRLRTRVRALAGLTFFLAVLIAGGLITPAGAVRATQLGKTRDNAKPACPDNPNTTLIVECQITGQVTGYQRAVEGKANLFKAKSNGRIVAWSVDLSKPSKEERNIFGEAAMTDEFGKSPTAGIGIIRKKENRRFKLLRHSPILKVQSYYGETPTFTLDKPLRVQRGDIVALTTATWLPAFSFEGQPRDSVWVGSRPRKNCNVPDSVPPDDRLEYFFDHTRPHRKVGSERKYQCTYTKARLLYWAFLAPRGNRN